MSRKLIPLIILAVLSLLLTPWLGQTEASNFIFWQIRVPRVLMGFLVGSTLGLAGAVYQSLFNNPLATPSTVGTTAGATLGALAATLYGAGQWYLGVPAIVFSAFFGSMLVTVIVALIAYSERAQINDVLLAGIALSLVAGALSTGLQFNADMASSFAAIRWSLGHLGQIGYDKLIWLGPICLISWLMMFSLIRSLQAMVSGEEKAWTMAVPVNRIRSLGLLGGALGLSVSVALCGPIAFVGLIVPHLTRMWLGDAKRLLLPGCWFLGGSFLVICDLVARTILQDRELPVGVMTAGLGAPILIYLLIRQRRNSY